MEDQNARRHRIEAEQQKDRERREAARKAKIPPTIDELLSLANHWGAGLKITRK